MKKAFIQALTCLITIGFLLNCSIGGADSLDSSIPRLQTPLEQIAYLRTKWKNGQHVETVFYDHRNRILEMYCFGRTNSKWLNRYEGNNPTTTIYYYHSDSSESGYIYIDTLRRAFDSKGRLRIEATSNATMGRFSGPTPEGYTKRYLAYTASGDTIVKKLESTYQSKALNSAQAATISRWERDDKQRLIHHYRLYVLKGPAGSQPDTVYYFSKRFAYDASGKLKMSWFDSLYLGRFYLPAGPDTTWYDYNSQNRLVAERHRYTTDMRNKRAISTAGLSIDEKKSIDWYRKNFFVDNNNNRVDQIRYHYERFDPARHLALKIPAVE